MQPRQGHERSKAKSLFWQQFPSNDARCVIQFKPDGAERPIYIFPTAEFRITFDIYGGSDIPQFRLNAIPRGEFFTPDEVGQRPKSSIIYPAWTQLQYPKPRTPTIYPALAAPGSYTFSYMLQDVHYQHTNFPKPVQDCEHFHRSPSSTPTVVSWAASHMPEAYDTMTDLHDPGRLSAEGQASVDSFMHLWAELATANKCLIRVYVAEHGALLESWKFLTALPHPSPRPFHRYAKGLHAEQGTVHHIEDCNENTNIGKFHGQRAPPISYHVPPLIEPFKVVPMFPLIQYELPGVYEVFQVGGVLRDYQYGEVVRQGYVNQRWDFQLIPMSVIRQRMNSVESYFVYLNIQEAVEDQHNFIQAPSTNTQVMINCGNTTYVGKVIASKGFELLMCVKRSVGPLGTTLRNLRGFFVFGPEHTPYLAAKKGVQRAMYGGKDVLWFKELLLARENRSLWRVSRGSIPSPLAPEQLAAIGFNPQQRNAFEIALAIGDSPRAKLTMCRGPPGTGKTFVLVQLILFCISRNLSVQLVSSTNAAVDVPYHALIKAMKEKNMSTRGIFRIRTCDLHSISGHHIAGEDDNDDSDNDGEGDGFNMNPVTDLFELGNEMITNFESFLNETVKLENDPYSISTRVHNRMKAINQQRPAVPNWEPGERERACRIVMAQQQLMNVEHDIENTRYRDRHEKVERLVQFLPGETWQDALARYLHRLRRQFDKAVFQLKRFYANGSRVLFVTTASSAAKFLKQCRRDVLLVDEVSQVKEYEFVACVARMLPHLQKVVMLGDPRQRSPFVADEEHNEFARTTAMSPMTRLIDSGVEYVTLRVQYRMCPDIAQFVNEAFNDNQLINHQSVFNRQWKGVFETFVGKYLRTNAPRQTLFLAVPDSKLYRTKRSFSNVNPWYLTAIHEAVRLLFDAGARRGEIAILSYYAAQLDCHRTIQGEGVELLTVDTTEGKEYRFVILDTATPGGPRYSLGFVANRERMHVALSRAQDGLVIVGDEDMGKQGVPARGELWRKLIQHHHHIGAFAQRQVDPRAMLQRLSIPGDQYELVKENSRP